MNWVSKALSDDALVADLLIRIKHSSAIVSSEKAVFWSEKAVLENNKGKNKGVLLESNDFKVVLWGKKQARTKNKKDKECCVRRFSPTTVLSCSFSDDASSATRSKGTCTNDSIACSSANKGSKRKKVACTNDSIACSSANKSSKRKKTDLHQQSSFGGASDLYCSENLDVCQPKGAEGSRVEYVPALNNRNMQYDHVVADNSKAERSFVVPDLNMMPSEDD